MVRWPARQRRSSAPHCKGESKVIDETYNTWGNVYALANESQGLAIAHQVKWTLSGSGLVHTRVISVDLKTLDIERSFILGTYRGSTGLLGMRFENNNLIVDTTRYTATFPRFLTSEEPPLGVIFP